MGLLLTGQVRLVVEGGEVAAVLLALLFADVGFEVLDAPRVPRVPALSLLESLPETVRERALAWERHVREVETGRPDGTGAVGPARAEYDPQTRAPAQREEAKASELSAAGMPTSAVTVRRMRARCRQDGVWGLVDHRATRPRTALGRADERVVAALRGGAGGRAGALQRDAGTASGVHRAAAGRAVRAGGGAIVLECGVQPARARSRRWPRAAGQCAAAPLALSEAGSPFVPTTVMVPGELVMMDSTVLDAFVVLGAGVVERPELTIAPDVSSSRWSRAAVEVLDADAIQAALPTRRSPAGRRRTGSPPRSAPPT
ncbi:hypothetical protein GCM10010236_81360 [Streptomyces eurythermus]|nr:hypothetical protein GCM10010236_81360 [Streptomyces eurythermus]